MEILKTQITLICLIIFCSNQIYAQDKLQVEFKGDPKPDIYIDGKKYDYEIVKILDQSKIESVEVIKGDKALEKYNAPNGVVIIKTKEDKDASFEKTDTIDNTEPLFILNGEVSDREALKRLNPKDIESIDVVKGQKAIDEYNAPNGVVIIHTKK